MSIIATLVPSGNASVEWYTGPQFSMGTDYWKRCKTDDGNTSYMYYPVSGTSGSGSGVQTYAHVYADGTYLYGTLHGIDTLNSTYTLYEEELIRTGGASSPHDGWTTGLIAFTGFGAKITWGGVSKLCTFKVENPQMFAQFPNGQDGYAIESVKLGIKVNKESDQVRLTFAYLKVTYYEIVIE